MRKKDGRRRKTMASFLIWVAKLNKGSDYIRLSKVIIRILKWQERNLNKQPSFIFFRNKYY